MLTRFLRLRPTKFSGTTDPMVANDWLRSVNKDFVTVGCTDAEKIRFAAHLLEGPAATWWDNFQITTPIDEVTWAIFEDGFRTAHISSGVMNLKKEFHNLKQRHRGVAEYIEEFNYLARYALDEVDTDAKRKEKFLEGLNDELNLQLSVAYVPTYQSLCDKAAILESKMKQVESRKRKHSDKHSSGLSHKRSHYDDSGSSGSHKHEKFNKHHNHNRYHDNKHHHSHDNDKYKNHKSGYKSHHSGNGSGSGSQPVKKDLSQVECFKCKNMGHYANECLEKKVEGPNKPNPFKKGQVNHINVEEIYEEPDAVAGKFKLNSGPAFVLFDTGASHSFISRAFVERNEIPVETIRCPIKVSSPGGEMIVNSGCHDLVIEFGKYKFPVNLIILNSQGLDVILGMDWMTKHKGMIDCANHTVSLTTPENKRIRFKTNFEAKRSRLNSLKGVSLDSVPIVSEYPDVFPEELPGMPPDRDVEFLIDLLPRSGPIAKRPYKMSVDDLKELKKQLG